MKVSEQKLHSQITDGSSSAVERYQSLALGSSSLYYLFKYELIMMITCSMPGALGLVLRKALYPRILGSVGRNVLFGRNVCIRHGKKIHISDNVIIDDNVTLDAKGEGNAGITVGSDCIISKNVVLSCKSGDIALGTGCSVGINAVIHATEGSSVALGDHVLVAAFVYIMGSGKYGTEEPDILFKDQGIYPQGGVNIESNVWIGSNAQIMDGVSIGTGSIVGSSSVVTRDVASYDVVAGAPARVIRSRKSPSS
ncbi:MAG: DapH/DapD/GlmU-related protein [Granulosicoccus sp.]